MKDNLLGISVKNLLEFMRIVALGFGRVELKLDYLLSSGVKLFNYNYKRRSFKLVENTLESLSTISSEMGVEIQFHLPSSTGPSIKSIRGFNPGMHEHHEILLKYYQVFEEIYQKYGIGSILTTHLPLVLFNGSIIRKDKRALKDFKKFILTLERIRRNESHQTKIGFENSGGKKPLDGFLGFANHHFEDSLSDALTIGTTFDVGHVPLSKEFDAERFLKFRTPVNIHLHGNTPGQGDEHLPPNAENVINYYDNLRLAKENDIPVILEIKNIENISNYELRRIALGVKSDLINA